MKKLLVSFLPVLALGCHGQVAPTTYVVGLNWPAAVAAAGWTGCTTSAPCTYAVSRFTLTSGTACPAATGQYVALNQQAPVSTLSYTDSTVPTGVTLCYVVSTVQGSAVSQPSPPSNSIVVPGIPLAPGAPTGSATTTTASVTPKASPDGDKPALAATPNTNVAAPGPVTATLRPVW